MHRAIAIATVIAFACPAAAEEAAPSARYSMTPIEGGVMRLDTLTGTVDRCVGEAGEWSCRTLPDEGRALQDEIDRLATENADLRARLSAAGPAETTPDAETPDGPPSGFRMPSEAEIDKAMDLMERVLERLKSMVDGLSEDGEKGSVL